MDKEKLTKYCGWEFIEMYHNFKYITLRLEMIMLILGPEMKEAIMKNLAKNDLSLLQIFKDIILAGVDMQKVMEYCYLHPQDKLTEELF